MTASRMPAHAIGGRTAASARACINDSIMFIKPLEQGISLPEHATAIALNGWIVLGTANSFSCPAQIFHVDVNAAPLPSQLFCNDGSRAAADKRVKDKIVFSGTGKNQLCEQLFRLLRRMRGIFRH